MKTVCAWCLTVLEPGDDQPISHGICKECLAIEVKRLHDKDFQCSDRIIKNQCPLNREGKES